MQRIEKDYRTGKTKIIPLTEKEVIEAQERTAKEKETVYISQRAMAYPAMGDQLDAEFKARQKRKLLVGQAREKIAVGDMAAALLVLLEACEPTDEQNMVDGKIMEVKRSYEKPE